MTFTGPIEDRIAIRELNGTYADAGFCAEKEQWLDCFTDDAIWITPFGELQGKEAIAAQWDMIWTMMDHLGFFVTVGAIEVNGDAATSRCFVREIFPHKDGKMEKLVGRYDDSLVRDGQRWRYSKRIYSVLIREEG